LKEESDNPKHVHCDRINELSGCNECNGPIGVHNTPLVHIIVSIITTHFVKLNLRNTGQ